MLTPVVGVVRFPSDKAFCLLLNVFQLAAESKPGWLVLAVWMFTVVPDPTTAPVPPVTVTPVVEVDSAPSVRVFCFAFRADCKSVWLDSVPVIAPQATEPDPPGAHRSPSGCALSAIKV